MMELTGTICLICMRSCLVPQHIGTESYLAKQTRETMGERILLEWGSKNCVYKPLKPQRAHDPLELQL